MNASLSTVEEWCGNVAASSCGVMVSSEDQLPCIHPKKRATDGKGSHNSPGFGDGHEISMGKLTTYPLEN